MIDRRAVVDRHRIEWQVPAAGSSEGITLPLAIGNGEFCVSVDGTGLQTFGGNCMSHWGWHSFPLPPGYSAADIPYTGTYEKGRLKGGQIWPKEHETLGRWLFNNPHRLNLGRMRLLGRGGREIGGGDISQLSRALDLWTGRQTVSCRLYGQPFRVETCVHPVIDLVAIRVDSPLLESGEIEIGLDFPYGSVQPAVSVGDFAAPEKHTTVVDCSNPGRADFRRTVDETVYHAALVWSPERAFRERVAGFPHRFALEGPGAGSLSFVLAFSPDPLPPALPDVETTKSASSSRWAAFWQAGGAMDLSGSRDPRWRELERRVVLSQYLMAAQSAGSLPPPEIGLMGIDGWVGQFHMEMIWWHMAHYALWDRWPMAEKAVGFYWRARPRAEALARQLEYRGMAWPKMTGPEGRNSVWIGNNVLLWKQPHPIHFAELEYRLRPGRATLEKWQEIVFGTADYMADYPVEKAENGRRFYSLDPVMPCHERGIFKDSVFELAYWRWGLATAQAWRERLGLSRDPKWEAVLRRLAPLPECEGVFVEHAEWPDTYTKNNWEHPDPIGPCATIPFVPGVDPGVARRTVEKVWSSWQWNRVWGWDFPWFAMAAARTGQPEIAVEALLKDSPRNSYPASGINAGWYLPGNGGLLYAVAMMAAGWDGAPGRNAPGFPDDGNWSVRWEGLKRAP